MVRLLIEDVTLIRAEEITAHVRFKGGANRTLTLPLPLSVADLRRADPRAVERIDQLLDHHDEDEIAKLLNRDGLRTGTGLTFNRSRVRDLRIRHGLQSHYHRRRTHLREQGFWTLNEMTDHLGVTGPTIGRWYDAGLLKAQTCGPHRLYEPPRPSFAKPRQGKKLLRTPLKP